MGFPDGETRFSALRPARRKLRVGWASAMGFALLVNTVVQAPAEEDVLVGRTAAGLLKVNIEFATPLALPISVYPGISGYATGDMGFHSTILDDPANDFFQLSPAGDFRLVLLAKDPGMEVWNDTGSGYLGVGELFYVGPAPFDTHPVWNLTRGIAGHAYSLTLMLHDVYGVYPDSASFVLSFTPLAFQLRLVQTDALQAELLWPTNAAGWALEAAGSMTGQNWAPITNAPTVIGTNFSLSVLLDSAQQLYRLHKQ